MQTHCLGKNCSRVPFHPFLQAWTGRKNAHLPPECLRERPQDVGATLTSIYTLRGNEAPDTHQTADMARNPVQALEIFIYIYIYLYLYILVFGLVRLHIRPDVWPRPASLSAGWPHSSRVPVARLVAHTLKRWKVGSDMKRLSKSFKCLWFVSPRA